jgi:AraC-like DNA-binding protein/mannose-6-phosphate isomerase-like protein (cupin superfamily)
MEKFLIRTFVREEKHALPIWIQRNLHTHENTPTMHVHEFIELVYIVNGKGKHITEKDSYEIRGGDVYIINPGEAHTYQVTQGSTLEIINCLFMPEVVQYHCLRGLGVDESMDYYYVHPFLGMRERFHHRLNLIGDSSCRVLHLMEEMIRECETGDSGYSTLIRIQLLELLILLSRYYVKKENTPQKNNSRKLLVQRIQGYLERNYEKKLSISMLSDAFNLSPRQLNRVFKEETGMTVFKMIHNIRVDKAKLLLAESDDKVITIAGTIGYEDPAFFNRLFLRKVGCSPGKYRELQQKYHVE